MKTGKKKKQGRSLMFSSQLFVYIFSASFLLLVVGLLVLYRVSSNAATKINNEIKRATLEISGENLNREFAHMDDIVRAVFLQQDILNCLTQDLGRTPSAYMSVRKAILSASANDNTICSMGIYDTLDAAVNTLTTAALPYSSYDSCTAYFSALPSSSYGASSWFFNEQNPRQPDGKAIVNLRPITPLNGGNSKQICMVIYLSEEKLCELYQFIGEDSYVMTADGTIVSAVDKTRLGQMADEELIAWAARNETHSTMLKRSRAAFSYMVYLPAISGYLVTSSGSAALQSTGRMITLVAILIVSLGLAVSLLGARYISNLLASPLISLKKTMLQVEAGDLNARSDLHRTDEIGYLGATFNLLMDSLVHQIEELRRQQVLTRKSEMRLLQAQINPHLLYNTLDSALYLIEHGNLRLAARILEELSRFFKLSLQSGNQIVPIEKELQHVEAYLNLQNLCRMKQFRFCVEGDPALQALPVLHMLLQPIVENSVLHGFEGNFADGTITIRLSQTGTMLKITVIDDGIGMEEAELATLRSGIRAAEPPAHSFALWNIYQRMRMAYGADCQIQIESEFGEYTAVTLELPVAGYGSEEDV